ncbi:hypothetical protein BH09PSE4_BH09PSE4_12140 [soil metagenome]
MLKSILLASAVVISAPVLAQTAPVTGQVAPGVAPMTDSTAQTAPSTAPAAPAADPAATAADPTAAATSQTSAAEPAPVTTPTGIAQVVNSEFPTYDKDASGALSESEFSAWMVALKTASDPKTDPASAAVKSWVSGAFAQADADKSKTVSKDELTGFLSAGQS